MALNLSQKQEVVAELAEVAGKASSLVAAEYAGVTVSQMTAMRKKARETGVFLKVAKNTLATRAVEGTDYEGAREFVERTKAAGDAVVTIDMSRYAYQQYLAPKFLGVDNDAELAEVERSHPRTWLLYTFPTRLAAVQPGIWSRLQREYTTAAEFPGTVSGGTIVVKVRP